MVLFWGSKVKVTGRLWFCGCLVRASLHSLGDVTSRRCGFEIGIECLLVCIIIIIIIIIKNEKMCCTVQRGEMDEVVMWSNVVLVLAVLPWLSYVLVLIFFSLSILYGSVSVRLVYLSLSLFLSVHLFVFGNVNERGIIIGQTDPGAAAIFTCRGCEILVIRGRVRWCMGSMGETPVGGLDWNSSLCLHSL